jgi:transcriptional regulator with XRE-family HTH domain
MKSSLKTSPKSKSGVSVADFITQQLALSPKSQREIATEIGYENPNVITMFKQGNTKLPLSKVKLLAQTLGLDPRYFLRIVMSEYMPETWDMINDILDDQWDVSDEEMQVIGVMRQAADGLIPNVMAEENRETITTAVRECVQRDVASNRAHIEALERLPKNIRKRA